MIDVALRGLPPERVKVEVHGPLGIHIATSGTGVTVCHLATGRAVLKNVSHPLAVQFIKDTMHLDWVNPASCRTQIEEAILKANPQAKV